MTDAKGRGATWLAPRGTERVLSGQVNPEGRGVDGPKNVPLASVNVPAEAFDESGRLGALRARGPSAFLYSMFATCQAATNTMVAAGTFDYGKSALASRDPESG